MAYTIARIFLNVFFGALWKLSCVRAFENSGELSFDETKWSNRRRSLWYSICACCTHCKGYTWIPLTSSWQYLAFLGGRKLRFMAAVLRYSCTRQSQCPVLRSRELCACCFSLELWQIYGTGAWLIKHVPVFGKRNVVVDNSKYKTEMLFMIAL